jgi:hypothetical protein
MSSSAPFKSNGVESALPAPIEIRPVRNSRCLRLRYDERKGVLKLTCPLRTSRRAALAWANEQRAWIEEQIAASLDGEPFLDGAQVPVAGGTVTLRWDKSASRSPAIRSGELRCGGPEQSFPARVEKFLKALALETLSRETAEYAARAGLRASAVAVGDPETRWGSCSAEGRIRYSWRLILAPEEARRYVVAHEVAHLAHLDHGPRFKALEAQLFEGDLEAARRSLRLVGKRLKRFGRGRAGPG